MSKTFLFQAIQFTQTVLIQTIQFSIIIVFVCTKLNVKLFYFEQFSITYKNNPISNNSVRSLNVKTVLFQAIQFSISTQLSSVWPIDRTLSGATTPGQIELGSDGNERVLCVPQSSSITGVSLLDCLVAYQGHSLVGSYPSAAKQSVYSTGLRKGRVETI